MANPIVNSLPAYVEQNKLPLIAKSVLRGKIQEKLNLMTGVKGDTALNLVGSDIAIQSGAECAFNASGDTTLSQRVLAPKMLKVNMTYCDKNLVNKWAGYQVKMAATGKEMPFEEDFMNTVADEINKANTKMIFQGASGQTAECEGFISILEGASATTVSTTGLTAWQEIKEVYMKTPAEVASKEDYVVLVSTGKFREFIQELVAKNLYHYNANDVDGEYTLPGTSVKVISTIGLDGIASYDYIIGARLSNLFLGVDMVSDSEDFDFYFDKSDRIFKLVVEWNMGVQVAYPSEVVLGKYSI